MNCWKCGHRVETIERIGFHAHCPQCDRALHVCRNCSLYDPAYNNQCRETMAERVVDKERSNFCEYFAPNAGRRCRIVSAGIVPAVAGARRARAARRAVQEENTMTTASGAIVLAAGLGTRMRSARAKVLHELGGEPMIARVMRSLAPLAPAPLVVVVGHQGDEVAAAARACVPGVRVDVALQPAQRGTGDAARCGLEAFAPDFDGDVLILYGDMPMVRPATLRAFIAEHRRAGADLSFISVMLDDPGAYGRVIRDARARSTAIVEARDASPAELAIREINTGVYLARAAVLRAALAELRPNNAQGEYYLTDMVAIARRGGLAVQAWCAPDAAEFAGINSREELAEMEAEIRAAVNRKLMEAGVTLVDPATAYIGEQVEIGRDSMIGPNVQILGRSKLGEGVRIEGTAWLRDVDDRRRMPSEAWRARRGMRIGEELRNRAVRQPARRHRTRRPQPHRQFRRDQKGAARPRHQGEPSELPRRRRRSAARPTSDAA